MGGRCAGGMGAHGGVDEQVWMVGCSMQDMLCSWDIRLDAMLYSYML